MAFCHYALAKAQTNTPGSLPAVQGTHLATLITSDDPKDVHYPGAADTLEHSPEHSVRPFSIYNAANRTTARYFLESALFLDAALDTAFPGLSRRPDLATAATGRTALSEA